jgi:hypothetical protein
MIKVFGTADFFCVFPESRIKVNEEQIWLVKNGNVLIPKVIKYK